MRRSATYRAIGTIIAATALWGGPALGGGLYWRSGRVEVAAMSRAEIRARLSALAERGGVRHVIVEFDGPVGRSQRRRLEAAGLKLLSYVPENAFFACIRAEGAEAAAVAEVEGVVGIHEIERSWKLHPVLARGEVPGWAIVERAKPRGKGQPKGRVVIGAYVLFHADVGLVAEGMNACLRHGAVVRSELETVNGLVIEVPVGSVGGLADEDAVQWIEPALPRMSEVNDSNRARVGADVVQDPPYSLDGSGVTVLVYDAGTALGSHADFGGRLTVRDGSGLSDHATHVCGTVGGDGSASGGLYRGMAPAVSIESYGFEYDGSGIFLYTNPGDMEADYNEAIKSYGADIANNSIGTNIVLNGFSCELMGDYGVTDMVIDSIVRGSLGAPFRVIWAAGNERAAPATCGSGYRTTGPPACAKNHITVGAVNSNDDSMTSFSSWGPTDDGRLKPDICAPGCQSDGDGGVTSCSSDGGYTVKCGTSMAAPTVTGVCALLLEDFREQFPGAGLPRNSTLKALLVHNAVDLGNAGPDYQFGYGSARIQQTIDFMRSGRFLEAQVDQGETYVAELTVEPGDPELKVTLAWDDWPGTPNASVSLVNDLDLRVFDPSDTQYFPWTLDPSDPSAGAGRTQADHTNNIEQVVVESPMAGVWRVEVLGFNVPLFPQAFSLCASHALPGMQAGKEVISRGYTVINLTDSPSVFNEAISRAYTVINLTEAPTVLSEAISRSFTVVNLTAAPPTFEEGISRSYTVINLTESPPVLEEGISRSVSVYSFVPGDHDCDGDVDLDDFELFAAAMNGPGRPAGDPAADLDEDGDCDLGDFAIFAGRFTGVLP